MEREGHEEEEKKRIERGERTGGGEGREEQRREKRINQGKGNIEEESKDRKK